MSPEPKNRLAADLEAEPQIREKISRPRTGGDDEILRAIYCAIRLHGDARALGRPSQYVLVCPQRRTEPHRLVQVREDALLHLQVARALLVNSGHSVLRSKTR